MILVVVWGLSPCDCVRRRRRRESSKRRGSQCFCLFSAVPHYCEVCWSHINRNSFTLSRLIISVQAFSLTVFFKLTCPSDAKIRSCIRSVSLHLQFLLRYMRSYLQIEHFLMTCGLVQAVGHSHCFLVCKPLLNHRLISNDAVLSAKWKHTFIVFVKETFMFHNV